jgi:nicotinamidase-related amidase
LKLTINQLSSIHSTADVPSITLEETAVTITLRGFEPGTRAALVISECQRGVVEVGRSPFEGLAGQVHARGIVPRIAELAAAFRAARMPVVHAWVAHRPDYTDVARTSMLMARSAKTGFMQAGSVEVEPVPGLDAHPEDHILARRFSINAFNGTDLDATLRHLGVKTLVLAGVSSNVAINSMAISGADFGYQVLVPEDCIAGATAESHAFMVSQLLPLYATVTRQSVVIAALQSPA